MKFGVSDLARGKERTLARRYDRRGKVRLRYMTKQAILKSMSRVAKATLIASVFVSSLTVWGVHFLQQQEHEVRTLLLFHKDL